MKHILTSLMLLCGLLANAADNYLVTTDGTNYPIDDPAQFVYDHSWGLGASSTATTYKFTSNGNTASVSFTNVKTVTLEIPLNGVISIEDYSNKICSRLFYNCTNLTEANITFNSDNCSSVGNGFCYQMFYNCSNLTSLSDDFNLPQDITIEKDSFCESMFYSCSSLQPGEFVELTFPLDASSAFSGTSFSPTNATAGSTYYIRGISERFVSYYQNEEFIKNQSVKEGNAIGSFAVTADNLTIDDSQAFRYWTYEDGTRAYETDVIEDDTELYALITDKEVADGETTYEYELTGDFDYDLHDCISISDNTITLTVGQKAYVVIEATNSVSASVGSETLESLSEGKYAYYYEGDAETTEITISDAANISKVTIYNVADRTLTFTSNGLIYTITGGKDVEITGVEDNSSVTSYEISTTVENEEGITFTVTSIANDAFNGLEVFTVTVEFEDPDAITLGEIADSNVGTLIVPEGSEWAYYNSDWATYFTIAGDISFTVDDFTYTLTLYDGTEVAISAYSGEGGDITIEPTVTADNGETSTIVSINEGVFTSATLSSVTVYWDEPATVSPVGAFTEDSSVTLIVPEGSEWAYYNSDWAKYFTIAGTISFTVDGFTYTLTDNTGTDVTISAYSGEGSEIEILKEVEADNEKTYSVVSIADNAFENAQTITSVKVNWATPIEISDKTFSGIESATLTVPENSEWAYYNSDWAKYFTIAGDISFTTEDGFEYTVTDQINSEVELTKYSGTATSIAISESVTKDEKVCTVKSIASDAFADYSELTLTVSSYIPFEGEKLSLKDSFKGILICEDDDVRAEYIAGGWGNYFAIEGDTFEDNGLYYQILSVSFGEDATNTVELIADASYSNLTSIEIPTSVEHTNFTFTVASIASDAFADAESLKEVTVSSDPAITIGDNAFATVDGAILYASGLEEAYASEGWTNYFHINGYAYVGETYHIDDLYYAVTATENGNTLEVIANDSYASLESVVIPDAIKYNDVEFTVTSIANGAFAGATNLTSVTVSWETPLEISEEGVFATTPETATLYIDTEVAEKERTYGQSNWANYFTIDGYIEGTRFIVDNLTYEITDQYENEVKIVAFDCDESVEIPVAVNDYTVTEIDEYVFTNCSTLKYVTIEANEPPCDASLFANVSEDAVLYVANTEAYATAGWHDYFVINGYVEKGDTFVVDNIEYKITNVTDVYEVQVIGTTATEEDTIEFVTEVDFNTFTFDVLNIADNAFDGQTALMAQINIIDPELITLGEIADVSEGKIGKLTVYPGTVNIYNESDWATYFEIAGNEYLEVDSVYYVFKISSNKASSSKNTITLEVDHVDENATEVTIPRTIDLGDNSSTTSYEVTSMNADALKDCKDLITINLEASIPAEDIEALNKVPDSVTIVLDEEELGAEYCESVKAAAAIAGIEVKMVSTAIVEVKVATDKVELERYNLLGQRISAPQRGINIVKYSDGTVEKVLVK